MADPKPPNPIALEKRQMFEDQEKRRDRDQPLRDKQQAAFGRALLAKLEQTPNKHSPSRVSMSGPPPLAHDVLPATTEPERIGGCFSDLLNEDSDAHDE